MNSDLIRRNWDVAQGRLKQEFADLTDDDLEYIDGEEEELLRRLVRRTGRPRALIEHIIAQSTVSGPELAGQRESRMTNRRGTNGAL